MSWNVFSQILIANSFFVDIVGLSNPRLKTQIQIKKINTLNNIITESQSFLNSPKESKFILPTGDGAAICFIGYVESPIELALELHRKLNQYNGSVAKESERIFVRIGIHAGPVIVLTDLLGNDNIWGSGIIFARRIMDIGQKNHILLSSDYVRLLKAVSEKWKDYKKMIHKIGYYTVKHDVSLMVYSAYSESFGNPSRVSKS